MIWDLIITGGKYLEEIGLHGLYQSSDLQEDLLEMV